MFRQLTAFIILLALLSQTFNKVVVVSSYYVNTTAYALNCVNKAKPQLQCNGKCQMMKKLKDEEKKDQKNNERKSSQNETLSSKSFFASVTAIRQTITVKFFNVNSGSPIDISTDFFHPPGR